MKQRKGVRGDVERGIKVGITGGKKGGLERGRNR
jgi:hypothetical protein